MVNMGNTLAYLITSITVLILAMFVLWNRRLSREINLRTETEEKRNKAEKALRSQARIIDQIHDSVIAVDMEGYITSWNYGSEKLFGYNNKDIIGKHISCVYPEESHDFLQNDLIPTLIKKGSHELEVKLLHQSGRVFYAHLSLSMLYDEDGKTIGMIGYTMDIDERKKIELELEIYRENLEELVKDRTRDLARARDEAEKASAAKSEFLSRMSHEFRTPLNAIMGFGQVLDMDIEHLNKEQQDCVYQILLSSQHLLTLINELLDLASIESGKIELQEKEVDITETLKQCLKLLETQINKKQLIIINQLQENSYKVLTDEVRLKQVILNLLSNAVKYNKIKGTIEINAQESKGNILKVSIRDTGQGIDSEDFKKLFNSFERLNIKNQTEGTGIGLAITKQLIELMGGKIGVNSVKGGGSNFWFELPLINNNHKRNTVYKYD